MVRGEKNNEEAASSKLKDQQTDLVVAKRSLLEREREFFKTRPMSPDLRSFIQRYKRKNFDKRQSEKRNKRSQEIAENQLYIVQNGQLVPLRNMKGFKRSEEKKPEPEGFTVVPLVIPINMKNPAVKFVKTRMLSEENAQLKSGAVPAGQAGGGAPEASTPAPQNEEAKPPEVEEMISGEEENSNSTREEKEVLHKILQDVEGLMQWKSEGNKKEGVICNINGSWISDAAGMRFDVCYQNSTRKKFRIHVADRIPPNEDGFLCDGNWTVFGEIPFMHSGMVIALAVHEKDRHIATFIGECRICEGSETVTGTWLVARSSRDCKDQKAAHKVLSDVWKREQAHTLRKKHLQKIGIAMDGED
ncbi:uncharacterized protein LOC103312381 isoform X1 [Tribolium castaneum]|uniref:uncharacterized protein LOC103312381 isoform X1 n=1 Tax=Tribolium castaneum TaxID=7070 RepID=UPI0030FE93C6